MSNIVMNNIHYDVQVKFQTHNHLPSPWCLMCCHTMTINTLSTAQKNKVQKTIEIYFLTFVSPYEIGLSFAQILNRHQFGTFSS